MPPKFDPKLHHRRSVRLQGYDYSQAGAYFVTIVTHQRECLFGEIAGGNMRLNEAGKIVQWEWLNLSQRFDYVELGAFVVMPNHFHGLVTCHETAGATRQGKTNASSNKTPSYDMAFESIEGSPLPRGPKPASLGAIIAQFKSRATKRLWKIPSLTGIPIWQRNYGARPEPVEGNISSKTKKKWTTSGNTSDRIRSCGQTMTKTR